MKKLASVLLMILLAGCNEGGGDSFVGNWQNTKNTKFTLAIERAGDAFLVSETAPSIRGRGLMDTTKLAANCREGQLRMQTAFGTSSISYLKASDTLLMPTMGGSVEYKRIK